MQGMSRKSRLPRIVLGLIGAYFAISIVLSVMLHGSIQFVLLPKMFDSINLRGLGNTGQSSGILSGDDLTALRKLADRLKDHSAPQSAAARAEYLDIVFFDVPQADSYLADIGLEFGKDWKGGAVLVPDGGARFVAPQGQPKIEAAFAVESVIAFDIANLPKGMLAGFRSEMLGARDAITQGDLTRAKQTVNDRGFCEMVRSWAHFHQVPLSRTRIWELGETATIKLDRPHHIGGKDARSIRAQLLCKETN